MFSLEKEEWSQRRHSALRILGQEDQRKIGKNYENNIILEKKNIYIGK